MPLARGYVQIYTGDGKGKTTAALGLLVRSVGRGLKVCLIQFLKPWPTSELAHLKRIPGVTLYRYGTSGWVRGRPSQAARRQADLGVNQLRKCLVSRKFDCIIADELCVAVQLGLVTEAVVLGLLAIRPADVELVLTGRGATVGLRKAADLVTEMKAVKHYHTQGVGARKGIEY